MSQYTLVRHSAYAVGGDSDFEDAVEPRELTARQEYQVRAVGGVLLPSLEAARAAAGAANFPPGSALTRPSATGYFSNLRIGGAEIYVPRATPGARPAGA